MKKALFILLLLSAVSSYADSYDVLWQKVTQHIQHDMPKKTITALNDIIMKAGREGDKDEMLAAEYLRAVTLGRLSADSLQSSYDMLYDKVRDMEDSMDGSAENTAAVAMYYTGLAHMADHVETTLTKEECFNRALQHPDILASVKTEAFRRMVTAGRDDVLYAHDLLSFIGHEAGRHGMLYEYYLSHANRSAACVEMYLAAQKGETLTDRDADKASAECMSMLREGMKRFSDTPEVALLATEYYRLMLADSDFSDFSRYTFLTDAISRYSEICVTAGKEKYVYGLRNALATLTCPMFRVNAEKEKICLTVRNVSDVVMNMYRLDADGTFYVDNITNRNISDIRKRICGKPYNLTRQYNMPEWQEREDTIDVPEMPRGVYLIEAKAGALTAYTLYYNTRLSVLSMPLSESEWRVVVADSKTGRPVSGACVVFTAEDYKGNIKETHRYTTGSNGETTAKNIEGPCKVFVYTADDKAFRKTHHYVYFTKHRNVEQRHVANIFTDRAIYRPGQILRGTVIVHNAANEEQVFVVAGKKLSITLRDAKGETIFADSVTTDDMGNAPFECHIPETLNNGVCNITCHGENVCRGWTSIRIEEYRRPTFEVRAVNTEDFREVIEVKEGAAPQAVVRFRAQHFSLMPVVEGRVTYSVTRRCTMPWWGRRVSVKTMASNVAATTDAEGYVDIPLTLSLPDDDMRCFAFTVSISVTDGNGETHQNSYTLRAARKGNSVMPQREEGFYISVSDDVFHNTDGVTLTIRSRARGQENGAKDHKGDTAGSAERYNTSNNTALRENTAKHYAYFTLISENGVEESGTCTFDSLYQRTFLYKEKYGEALALSYIIVYDGEETTFHATIRKPKKDMTMKVVWETFRDFTTPGAEETWTLSVAPGTKASLLATLYDSSLDALMPLTWNISPLTNTFYISAPWSFLRSPAAYASAAKDMTRLKSFSLSLAQKKTIFSIMPQRNFGNMLMAPAASGLRIRGVMTKSAVAEEREAVVEDMAVESTEGEADKGGEKGEEDLSALVRTALGETAFFTSSAMTDANGRIRMTFRMPQTLTTWRFRGIVHDATMRHAILDTLCTARKDIMIHPNIPRFLRPGDRAVLRATIENATPQETEAEVVMQYLCDSTIVWQEKKSILLKERGVQTVTMTAAETPANTRLTLRVAVSTPAGSADGEQHAIAILPETERVTTATAFTHHEKGLYRYDIGNMMMPGSTERIVRVRYADCAEKMILDAVPAAAVPENDNALSVASALYVRNTFSLTDSLGLHKLLRSLQNAEGLWSWWKGMEGSVYISSAVARLLARLELSRKSDSDTRSMLRKAMPKLMEYLSEEVERMKKTKRKNVIPSETAIDIVYVASIMEFSGEKGIFSQKQRDDIEYVIGKIENVPHILSIYGTAHTAAILAMNGRNAKAKRCIERLKEYSVYTEEAGRYYDSQKAGYSWRNYKIPSQVAVIEALAIAAPEDVRTISEMQRWLLHEKRTQQWNSSVNTADAIHAFMIFRDSVATQREPAVITLCGETVEASCGDVRTAQRELAEGGVLTVEKKADGTSWGAVYVDQSVKTKDLTTHGNGFSIEREILMAEDLPEAGKSGNGSRRVLKHCDTLRMGQRVTVRITIKAVRDYDFVTVTDNRMAALQPVVQLSSYCTAETAGTARGSYSGYYRIVKDTETRYCFNHMAKGTHILETEYFVDREGSYSQGAASVVCEYADEFSAMEGGKRYQ